MADFYSDHNTYVKRPYTVLIDGKNMWKVPVYYIKNRDTHELGKLRHYIYFDPATGKSKADNGNWKTLKELDEIPNKDDERIDPALRTSTFRNMLRDLY